MAIGNGNRKAAAGLAVLLFLGCGPLERADAAEHYVTSWSELANAPLADEDVVYIDSPDLSPGPQDGDITITNSVIIQLAAGVDLCVIDLSQGQRLTFDGQFGGTQQTIQGPITIQHATTAAGLRIGTTAAAGNLTVELHHVIVRDCQNRGFETSINGPHDVLATFHQCSALDNGNDSVIDDGFSCASVGLGWITYVLYDCVSTGNGDEGLTLHKKSNMTVVGGTHQRFASGAFWEGAFDATNVDFVNTAAPTGTGNMGVFVARGTGTATLTQCSIVQNCCEVLATTINTGSQATIQIQDSLITDRGSSAILTASGSALGGSITVTSSTIVKTTPAQAILFSAGSGSALTLYDSTIDLSQSQGPVSLIVFYAASGAILVLDGNLIKGASPGLGVTHTLFHWQEGSSGLCRRNTIDGNNGPAPGFVHGADLRDDGIAIGENIFYDLHCGIMQADDSQYVNALNCGGNLFDYQNGSGTVFAPVCGPSGGSGPGRMKSGEIAGQDDLDGDPLFVDPDNDDYHLSQINSGQVADSPALDAGKVLANHVYVEGTTRTDGVTDAEAMDLGYHYNAQRVARADLDGDGDVDPNDFLTFSLCFNGSLTPPQDECENPLADIDQDGDVDGNDFLTFSICFNGSLNPPNCD